MTPSDARRAQLEALAKETKERVIDVVVAQLMEPDDDEPALSIRRQANHEQIEALLLHALLRADASPPAALEDDVEMTDAQANAEMVAGVRAIRDKWIADNPDHGGEDWSHGESDVEQFALMLIAKLNRLSSPPAALPAETPRAETCATCRHNFTGPGSVSVVCAKEVLPPASVRWGEGGAIAFGCTLHEPQASRAVEGAAEPLAHIDHAQDGSAE